jgi:hypothetical protein
VRLADDPNRNALVWYTDAVNDRPKASRRTREGTGRGWADRRITFMTSKMRSSSVYFCCEKYNPTAMARMTTRMTKGFRPPLDLISAILSFSALLTGLATPPFNGPRTHFAIVFLASLECPISSNMVSASLPKNGVRGERQQ